ncbi:MAG: hypothetical protein QM775_07580 [Pirellulales bacterium]
MDVHHFPAVSTLREEPIAVGLEDFVVACVRLRIVVAAGRSDAVFDRQCVEHRRRKMHHVLRAGGEAFLAQELHTFAVLHEALFCERFVDPAIHPVAGDDYVRLHLGQHALQAFVNVRPRELAAGMTFFGKP